MPSTFVIHRVSARNDRLFLHEHLPKFESPLMTTQAFRDIVQEIMESDESPEHKAFHAKYNVRGMLPIEMAAECMCGHNDDVLYRKAFSDYNLLTFQEAEYTNKEGFPVSEESWVFNIDEDCLKFIDQYMSNEWFIHDGYEQFNTEHQVTQTYKFINSQGITLEKVCTPGNYRWNLNEK